MEAKKPLETLSLPLKTRLQLAALTVVTDAVCRSNGTINRHVMKILDLHFSPNPNPNNSVSTHDYIFDVSKNLSFRLFVPHHNQDDDNNKDNKTLPIIVYFHGGGFTFLSPKSYIYDNFCRRLAFELDAIVCSVDYRLAPEHKFPSQYEDGFSFLEFLDNAENRRKITHWPDNADVSTVFLAGDSAGGNLSHHLAVYYARSSSTFSLNVVGLINIQPFFGGKERVNSEIELEGAPVVSMGRTARVWKAFLPNEMDLDHWAVNVSGPNAVDITGLNYPPTVVFVGGFDPLKDWQKRYYQWLKKNEKDVKLVEFSNAIHAFNLFPELPETNLMVAEIKKFIDNQVSKLSKGELLLF